MTRKSVTKGLFINQEASEELAETNNDDAHDIPSPTNIIANDWLNISLPGATVPCIREYSIFLLFPNTKENSVIMYTSSANTTKTNKKMTSRQRCSGRLPHHLPACHLQM